MVLGGLLGLLLTAGVAAAVTTSVQIDRPARTRADADRVIPARSGVAVGYDVREVDDETVEAMSTAASEVGALVTNGRVASVGLIDVLRDGEVVHAAPDGYYIPMIVTTAGDPTGIYGPEVAAALSDSAVALNERSAQLMGVEVGDRLRFGTDGGTLKLRVALIASYDDLGGNEVATTIDVAERLGVTTDTRAIAYYIDDEQAFDDAIADTGIEERGGTNVGRSWDAFSPDSTLNTVDLKVEIGEAYYRPVSDSTISMEPSWVDENLTDGYVLLNDEIRVRAQCHVDIVQSLKDALADVAEAGLHAAIEVGNANTYGGCYNPRYNRHGGFLSRHAYAVAWDTNTVTNCQGCEPPMNCDVVQIFRKHGFAWGGNFTTPDGMHFEWVGEPRDQIPYDSEYCPNEVPDDQSGLVAAPTVGNAVLSEGPIEQAVD